MLLCDDNLSDHFGFSQVYSCTMAIEVVMMMVPVPAVSAGAQSKTQTHQQEHKE
jgi:hypothetical protein